ncbi:CubicO group peptidase (beta-lactamase class C family) [Aquimarina sp. EL_43]|uniref:serine hydrolase n=1 Tax=unclassified Aquimarina TaxID=2627091 RepID=UPI0018CB3872|nr:MULTISPECIES: serine hydrolase [unclassified Aquimarina]MBG6130089.1 CubicO group peptidase (beta-lactamase class C family) [Aquimarina sp. EL_35]MBG6148869.1 CubicO group peptidase (beta-lactamase class C family) [Aquimarina sp. EL_32]MBG6168757.1 CubicO group peptidase (beta-lactamase class C family) [Aquimarina sp. EL_43]
MKKLLLLFTVLLISTTNILSQTGTTVDLKKLDEYYAKMAKDWDIPSVSIGIVKDGKLIFSGNYGGKEKGKDEKPDENTLYAIASNSKAFTATIIGMLVQEGKLNWDDKVKKHLPYFALYDPWVSNQVTIRDILSHRVGLGTFSGDVIWYKANLTSEEIIKRIKHLPKTHDFRSGFGYSNVMYITAGEIIKKVTGKSWGENVKERILDPLGMDRTITSYKKLDTKKNYATPHGRENDKNIPIDWVDWEEIGAMGGLISSVKDVSKWMIFNLNHGRIDKDTLLTKNTRNMIWTPHNNYRVDHTSKNDFNKHFSGYGLGWGLSDYQGRLSVAHTGGFDGMITAVTLIPDENLGVVVLTNGMKSPIRAATYYALDQFLGTASIDWSAKLLKKANNNGKKDTRISKRKEKRELNTKPSVAPTKIAGDYMSDIYGKIKISLEKDQLRMKFEHTPDLSATLRHWHHDVWEIVWDKKHAWFSFGTVKFNTDNNLNVKSMDFDVPNDDIFFEELKPYRVSK